MGTERFDSVHDLFERLHGDSRMNPIPEHVMKVETTEGLKDAKQLVDHAIRQKWTTAAELARRTNLKPSAISAFRNDKWRGKAGTLETTASMLAKAVNQIIREREAAETRVGGFVTTRVAEAMFSIVQYTIKRQKIAVFLVPAGSGKTMALTQLAVETPGAVLLAVKGRRGTVKSFLQLWARALGLDEIGRAEDIQDRIIQCLEGSHRLILIDEAHKLTLPAIDVIREVWDDCRIPIVMAATPSFYQTITSRRVGTQQSELMDQFYSRVGVFRDLTSLENPNTGEPERLYTPEDIRKVFNRGRVRIARDGADFLCKLANTPGAGGLRVCADLVQLVIDLYPREQVTAQLLNTAMVTRVGVKEAGFRVEQAAVYAGEGDSVKIAVG